MAGVAGAPYPIFAVLAGAAALGRVAIGADGRVQRGLTAALDEAALGQVVQLLPQRQGDDVTP